MAEPAATGVPAGMSKGTGPQGHVRRDWRPAALLAALTLALVYAFPYAERTRNANERPRLLQAASLVERGSWRIDGVAGLDPGPDVARDPASGALYPNKPPGTTLVAAAAYAGSRGLSAGTGEPLTLRRVTAWARLLAGALPTLALCGLLWRTLAPGFGGRAAALAIALYALGTPAAAYAHLLYGHQLAACLLWAGLALLLRARAELRPGPALLGGLLAGSAVTVEYAAAFAGLPLAALAIAALREGPRGRATAAAAVLGALVPAGLLAAYHAAVFGGPLRTGYHLSATAEFAEKHGEGLLGLVAPNLPALRAHVLSLETGLLGWAPLAPLALVGLGWLARGSGPKGQVRRARVELAMFAALLLACVSLNFEGGWRVGPRYLVAVLPALALGWAALASRALSGPPRGAGALLGLVGAAALASYSLVVNGLAANLWPHFDPTNVHQPVAEVLLPLWRAGRTPYTLAGALGLPEPGIGWLLLAALLGCAALAMPRALGRRGRAAVALGVALGLGLVAATRLVAPHPRGAANLAYIERVWEPPLVGGEAPSAVLRPGR